MDRHLLEADIRKLERQRAVVGSAEERVMLDLQLGDRRADLANCRVNGRAGTGKQGGR